MPKTKLAKSFHFYDGLYNLNTHVVAGTADEINAWRKKQKGINIDAITGDTFGEFQPFFDPKRKHQFTIITLRLPQTRRNLILTTVHEALHQTNWLLTTRGIELVDESDEAYAYYHTWLVDKILSGLIPNWLPKKKKRV